MPTARTHRESLKDTASATNAAVHQNGDLVADCFNHLGQSLDGVELTSGRSAGQP